MDPAIQQNQRGDIKIKIGKQDFVLEATMQNIDAMESVLKKTLIQMLDEIREKKLTLTTQEFATFVFIAQKEPKKSFNFIRKLIHEHGTTGIIPGVALFANGAISGALEDPQESAEMGNPEAKTS